MFLVIFILLSYFLICECLAKLIEIEKILISCLRKHNFFKKKSRQINDKIYFKV